MILRSFWQGFVVACLHLRDLEAAAAACLHKSDLHPAAAVDGHVEGSEDDLADVDLTSAHLDPNAQGIDTKVVVQSAGA
jgi:hypothetical protein